MTPQTPPPAAAAATPPPGAPGAAAPPAAGAPPAKDAAALEREIEQLKQSNGELQRTAEFWRGKASDKPADKTPPPATEDDVDLLAVIATKGVKGLDEVLKKRGYISKEEADQLVNAKAGLLKTEEQLYDQYPELKDQNSEFFKATAAEYRQLKNAGVPEHLAMSMAAKSTALSFLESGKRKTRQQQTDETKAQKEADRLARIAAQGGDRGARTTADDEGDDEITPAEERIIRNMLMHEPGADGKLPTYEQAVEKYRARAKAGVQVSRRTR